MHQKELCYICTKATHVVLFYMRPNFLNNRGFGLQELGGYQTYDDKFFTALQPGVNCSAKVINELKNFTPEDVNEGP